MRALFASATYDTLDAFAWPSDGKRLALLAAWSPAGLGPTHAYWRIEGQGRLGRALAARTVVQLDGLVGLSGSDLPVYDWQRLGGVELLPGYRHEQLKGAQALAAAASLRYRLAGDLRVVVRAGAGNVFARTSDIRLTGLRWGVAIGAMLPTRVGPVSAELAVHDGGGTLVAFALGWN